MNRIIALIDMDCFYCQVETKLNPDLQGLPVAVVQYNEWKGGGIIAVNYEAREKGVTRYMRGQEAQECCSDIVLVKVPTLRGKADLSRYRDASRDVVAVLCSFSDFVERASVDEAYIDLTAAVNKRIEELSTNTAASDLPNTFVVGFSTESVNCEEERICGLDKWLEDIYAINCEDLAAQKLAVGAVIVEEIRSAVYKNTGFKCSAGIAHNKILAKLACGLHKPNKQTVVPHCSVPGLYKNLPVKKIRSLGGKLGEDLTQRMGVKVMEDLLKFTESEFQHLYDSKTGTWLFNIARGYDYEPVNPRLLSKSIGCCKRFPGRTALIKLEDINHWITKLAEELLDRLNEDKILNKRRAQLLTVSLAIEFNKKDISSSKSFSLTCYSLEKLVSAATAALKKTSAESSTSKTWNPPVKYLGLSAGKFVNETSQTIINFFKTKKEDACEEELANLPEQTEMQAMEDAIPQELSSNKEIHRTPSSALDEVQPSFFEKIFFHGISNNNRKLNIVPDLNKVEYQYENSDSKDSWFSENSNSNERFLRKDKLLANNSKSTDRESSLNEEVIKRKDNVALKKRTNSILSFLSSNTVKQSWISPEEVFPDPNNIDEDLLKMFPLTFRKKVLDLKKVVENNRITNKTPSQNNCEYAGMKQHENVGENQLNKPTSYCCSDAKGDPSTSENIQFYPSKECTQLEYKKCLECDKNIAIVDYDTHSDFHVARKLYYELNHTNSSLTMNIQNQQIPVKIQTAKKRKKTIDNKNFKLTKKNRGIEYFFKK